MSKNEPDRSSKIVEFLKTVGSNPDRKLEDIAKELEISRTSGYNYRDNFIQDIIYTELDPDFPRRVLELYNERLPPGTDQLDANDIGQWTHLVDEYKRKNAPPTDTININQDQSRTMSYNYPPPVDPTRDGATDEGYLRTLLMNQKNVSPTIIERFIQNYSAHKDDFHKNPLMMLENMKWMFGPQAGQNIYNIWQSGRGKFVYGADQGNGNGGINPMLLMMMMQGGGGMNPAMMPMLMGNGGGDSNMMLIASMLSQQNQDKQRMEARQFQQEQMDKLMNMMMMRFATASMDEKNPWMNGMGGAPMGMMVNEYPDESGRVKYRQYIPNFGQPGMMQGQHTDPIVTTILQGQMAQNTALLGKLADSGNGATSILNSLIPNFLSRGNVGTELAQMIDTMNKVSPGFFDRSKEPTPNLEVMKMKYDTDLALNAQRLELAKLEHNWRVDEMDRKAANDNAKSWMDTIGSVGDKIVTTVAPAIVEGFGKGMLNRPGQQPPTQTQQQYQMQQQRVQQQAMAAHQQQLEQERLQQQEQQQPVQQPVTQQVQPDPGIVYMISTLQSQLQQSENNNKILLQKLQEMEAQPPQQARQLDIDEKKLGRLSTGQLQSLLQELQMQTNAESRLAQVINVELHNRSLIGDTSTHQHQDEPTQSSDPSVNKQFETGEEPMEKQDDAQNVG